MGVFNPKKNIALICDPKREPLVGIWQSVWKRLSWPMPWCSEKQNQNIRPQYFKKLIHSR